MIQLSLTDEQLRITDTDQLLTPTHRSMLTYWQFSKDYDRDLVANCNNVRMILRKVLRYLNEQELSVNCDEQLQDILSQMEADTEELRGAAATGSSIKSGSIQQEQSQRFLEFIRHRLARRLLPHQEKAALHLLNIPHGANFSVPGAGKSAVVLSVFSWLREKKKIRSMFIVGPRSCFAPWQHEYQLTLGEQADAQIIAGGNISERRLNYYPHTRKIADLYLTTYQTLSRDIDHAVKLFCQPGNDVLLVVDEAHYIKQEAGIWASAVLTITSKAAKRCVLTGTPFPKSYSDAINIFETLYPGNLIFSEEESAKIRRASEKDQHDTAKAILEPIIDPFYYRVRKTDLGLSKPVFLPPVSVTMKPVERELYEAVANRLRSLTNTEIQRDFETIQRLKRGRLMRLRQALSYSALLFTAIEDYEENLFEGDEPIAHKIAHYDELETPGKIDSLLHEIGNLQDQREKVVVWSNFIGALELIQTQCKTKGWNAKVICGATPTQEDTDEETREQIVEEFKNPDSGLDILIANPAACAESISLHKTCSNAIYYDLSYNCAEYLQSIDRIHRVGGSETKVSYYRYLQYERTVEPSILQNLLDKAERMSQVIDIEFPLCITDLDDIAALAYEQLNG